MFYWVFIILLLIATSVLVPAGFLWLTQHSRFAPFLHSLHGVQATFIGVMSVMFSLNLVFVCNEIWQAREAAKSAMSRESESLRNIGRVASNIRGNGGADILRAERLYLEAALAVDFPVGSRTIATEIKDSASLSTTINLSDAILNDTTLDKLNPAVQQMLVAQLTVVRDRRLDRMSLRDFSPNIVKWLSLVFLEIMTLLTIVMVHVTNGRAMFVACCIFLSGVNPFLTVLYFCQSPFDGIYPLKTTRLEAALDRITAMEADYQRLNNAAQR